MRFALIGCGAIARKHITAISRIENARVVGVFDTNTEAAAAFSEQHGVPWFDSVERLIDDADPTFLNILTPSGCHASNVLGMVEYGRHFVVEKPLALRLSEVDEIIDQCARRRLQVHVVKQNRFNPPVAKLKEAIDKGRFGKLVLGTIRVRWKRDQAYYDQKEWRGTWALDGGVFTNQASHHIDALLWLMGEPQSVMAKISTRLVDIEAEDTGAAIIKFKNGALGILEATTATRPKDLEGAISILGEKGTVEVGGFFMNELRTWNFAEPDKMDEDIWDQHACVPNQPAWNHTEFFRGVVNSYVNGTKGMIDEWEGRKSIELINAIYESAERGEEVVLRYTPQRCRLGVAA